MLTPLSDIEAEIKNRNISHARNLLDRAVTHLPRVDKLWYKYLYVYVHLFPLVLIYTTTFLTR